MWSTCCIGYRPAWPGGQGGGACTLRMCSIYVPAAQREACSSQSAQTEAAGPAGYLCQYIKGCIKRTAEAGGLQLD